jgi:hypothetical protein
MREERIFCNWFLRAVHYGCIDPKLTFFADETLFHPSGSVSAQDGRYWDSIDLKQTFEDVTIGVCGVT